MDAYIIKGYRTAVTRAKKGKFKNTRPDDLAVDTIKYLVNSIDGLEPGMVDDLIVGNAVQEAEQGMQMGRMISLMALGIDNPGMVINRYCGSGLEAIHLAAAKINAGMADLIIAGGTESMSMVPIMGFKTALNYNIASETPTYYTSMGQTAEQVSKQFKISREDQDEFAYNSHMRAINAQKEGLFTDDIVPIHINETYVNEEMKKVTREFTVDVDEGPRPDTSIEALSKLRPVFTQGGTVTAGNSSPTNDGAAFVLVASEKAIKELNLKPTAQLLSYAVAGVDPKIMGIGPVKAIPKALDKAGLNLNDIDLFEVNEAFAAQAVAVVRELGMDIDKTNVNGGAIALGHPLGSTCARLSITLLSEMARRDSKYGIVSACVGGGQGVAGVYERL
jgi:acetyl-CoA acyltransferase